MDTRVAYWTQDANGNLTLFNTGGQKLTTVPVTQAASYIAAYSQGDPRATDLGKASSLATSTSSGSSAAAGPTWAQQQSAAGDVQAQKNWQEMYDYNKARGDQQMQLSQAELALRERQRIDALHGPQDYIKYWRASRGLGDETAAAPAAAASTATGPTPPAWAANVKVGVPAGAQTWADAPGGPAWAWNDKPAAGFNVGVQNVIPKSAVIATSGLGDQTKPVSLSDWAVQQMKAGGMKF